MGFLDTLKAKLSPAKEKVGDLAHQHGGKIDQGLDKAARTVDQKTKGKYSDKIESGTRKAKEAVERLSHKHDEAGAKDEAGATGDEAGAKGDESGTPPGTPPAS
ncbi:antitoxin [Streptomyces sp. NPDC015032]|uniref:antitoxin n=1 Tax=Streptomyces sp. NPDC015032 TaxID=3364937 RepID=UPI0036F521B1